MNERFLKSLLATTLVASLALVGCDKSNKAHKNTAPVAPAAPTAAGNKVAPAPGAKGLKSTTTPEAAAKAPMVGKPATVPVVKPAVPTGEPRRDTAKNLVVSLQLLAAAGDIAGVAKLSTPMSSRGLRRFQPAQLSALFKGEISGVRVNGGREVVAVKDGGRTKNIVTYNRPGGYQLDIMKSTRWQEPDAGPPEPLNKILSLKEATEGLKGEGKLYVKIATSMGDFNCELYEQQTPKTVATFVGLARGLRGFADPKTKQWSKRKFYDGLLFHRVIPRFMIQGGDPTGTGSGGIGFTSPDEFDLKLRHTKGGLLSMANRGPNTNGSQFFVTEKATPWLDDGHTIFGACAEIDLVKKITGVAATRSRPNTPVTIKAMTFARR